MRSTTGVLKLVDFAVVVFLGTWASCLLKQMIDDAVKAWCVCIKDAQDREDEVLVRTLLVTVLRYLIRA